MNIIIAGDIHPKLRVAGAFAQNDFATVLGEVKTSTESVDFSIVNFESPITNGNEHPIEKLGPKLSCSEKGLEAVKWAGFDCVTLANNHFLDYGSRGARNTLDVCEKLGLDVVGGGLNLKEASKTLYKEIRGERLAVINCCEHEFSIATDVTAGSNPLNPIQQYYAIKEARAKADHVLVIVHGGHEHYQLPSLRMQETYRFFIDAGADAVVNHHQHCFSGYEIYKGKPIFYGLGNFCIDRKVRKEPSWHEGYMVEIQFADSLSFVIHPYLQCLEEPRVHLLEPTSFDNRLNELNNIIANQELLRKHQEKYYQESAKHYMRLFEPLYHHYFQALRLRGCMPSFVSKERRLMATDFILCESHRDKLVYYLNSY